MVQIRNVPADLHRQLKVRAAVEGLTMSDYVLREVRKALEAQGVTCEEFAFTDSNDVFHVMDVLSSENPGSGPEQTIPGVLRVQFGTDSRTLSMDLLTRGDSRDPARVSRLKASRPDLVSRWSLTDAETEYVLDEISVQWRIRNYEYK